MRTSPTTDLPAPPASAAGRDAGYVETRSGAGADVAVGAADGHGAIDTVGPDGTANGLQADEAAVLEVADLTRSRDALMARIVLLLVRLRDSDRLADLLGGMSLQVWLEHHCRLLPSDARRVLGTSETLAHLPATHTGLRDGWLSWSQVAATCSAARRVPVGRLGDLDRLVSDALVSHREWEPAALVDDVWTWVDRQQPSRLERDERAAQRGEFLTLSPRLFGGGSLYGELGTTSFATVTEALDAPLSSTPRVDPDAAPDEVDAAYDTLDDHRRTLTRRHGTALAARLVGLCESSLAGTTSGGDGVSVPARPLLLATLPVASLLDDDQQTPGWLLHTLVGGRMRASASLLRDLVDTRGADLRTIVLDDHGQAIGVGHKTRIPPGWLREAIWARDLQTSDPDRRCPVRRADLDHTTPWPDRGTDVDNLHPLSRTWHNHKTTRRWTVSRARDGTTTWTHHRHGWTLHLAPPRRDLDRPPPRGPDQPPLPLHPAPT